MQIHSRRPQPNQFLRTVDNVEFNGILSRLKYNRVADAGKFKWEKATVPTGTGIIIESENGIDKINLDDVIIGDFSFYGHKTFEDAVTFDNGVTINSGCVMTAYGSITQYAEDKKGDLYGIGTLEDVITNVSNILGTNVNDAGTDTIFAGIKTFSDDAVFKGMLHMAAGGILAAGQTLSVYGDIETFRGNVDEKGTLRGVIALARSLSSQEATLSGKKIFSDLVIFNGGISIDSDSTLSGNLRVKGDVTSIDDSGKVEGTLRGAIKLANNTAHSDVGFTGEKTFWNKVTFKNDVSVIAGAVAVTNSGAKGEGTEVGGFITLESLLARVDGLYGSGYSIAGDSTRIPAIKLIGQKNFAGKVCFGGGTEFIGTENKILDRSALVVATGGNISQRTSVSKDNKTYEYEFGNLYDIIDKVYSILGISKDTKGANVNYDGAGQPIIIYGRKTFQHNIGFSSDINVAGDVRSAMSDIKRSDIASTGTYNAYTECSNGGFYAYETDFKIIADKKDDDTKKVVVASLFNANKNAEESKAKLTAMDDQINTKRVVVTESIKDKDGMDLIECSVISNAKRFGSAYIRDPRYDAWNYHGTKSRRLVYFNLYGKDANNPSAVGKYIIDSVAHAQDMWAYNILDSHYMTQEAPFLKRPLTNLSDIFLTAEYNNKSKEYDVALNVTHPTAWLPAIGHIATVMIEVMGFGRHVVRIYSTAQTGFAPTHQFLPTDSPKRQVRYPSGADEIFFCSKNSEEVVLEDGLMRLFSNGDKAIFEVAKCNSAAAAEPGANDDHDGSEKYNNEISWESGDSSLSGYAIGSICVDGKTIDHRMDGSKRYFLLNSKTVWLDSNRDKNLDYIFGEQDFKYSVGNGSNKLVIDDMSKSWDIKFCVGESFR